MESQRPLSPSSTCDDMTTTNTLVWMGLALFSVTSTLARTSMTPPSFLPSFSATTRTIQLQNPRNNNDKSNRTRGNPHSILQTQNQRRHNGPIQPKTEGRSSV
mmetsp:Transcript_22054/g.61373  ORF Transcript_22054/g.61373 Transcript_22054/m.61373 type:complete len:103 (+) Transcript_22054:528-836(+)